MSVLHNRIIAQPAGQGPEARRPDPSMMPATPLIMPASEYRYDHTAGVARYGAMEPWWTGDANAGAMPVHPDGTWGRVVPAGRP